MRELVIARALGALAVTFTTISTIFNGVFAFALDTLAPDGPHLTVVSFGFNVLTIAGLLFLLSTILRSLTSDSTARTKGVSWRYLFIAVAVSAVTLCFSLGALIWVASRAPHVSRHVRSGPSKAIYVVWFISWACSVFLQGLFYRFLCWWTKQVIHSEALEPNLDFGIGSPNMNEIRPRTRDTNRSFHSQDITLVSPPRTPTTLRPSSSRRSSLSTKGGPASSRTRLIHKESAKSSLESPSGELVPVNYAFDQWDTSSVHHEVRAALSTSPLTKSALETIPGSRPESPATALDGPFLPSPPHAASPESGVGLDYFPSSPQAIMSTPPSSEPNSSQPTSRSFSRPIARSSSEEHIHPLFRSDSPSPPPIAKPGTTVTASPLAGKAITPKTLSRVRSGSLPQYRRPFPYAYVNGNSSKTSLANGSGTESPGPSVVEEENLPPIIPGFVLSAGQRTSFVGYGKRKSVKDRPQSASGKRNREGG